MGVYNTLGAFPLWKLLGTENSIIVEKNKSSGANRSYFDYIFQNFEVQLKYKTHRSPGFFFYPDKEIPGNNHIYEFCVNNLCN